MNSIDFVIQEINLFVEKFPKTRVRYEFDEKALVHVIEVVPNEVYHLDEAYIEWEDGVFNRFVTAFPLENICFISDDALVGIENPILTIKGKEYGCVSYTLDKKMTSVAYDYHVVLNQLSMKVIKNLTVADTQDRESLEGIYYSFPQAA